MNLRSLTRTTILVTSLAESLARFALLKTRTTLLHRRPPTPRERATWLHGCCLRILRRLRIPLTRNAALPASGLIVSNHLSHLDILLYGSLGPIIFVSKEEVRQWPLLGKLAECGGTVFIDRERTTDTASAAEQMEAYLTADRHSAVPVLLFPEGTSSDGTQVLPFRSPLFEPAIRARAPITAASIAYSADGVDEEVLTYYGEKVFFPHLVATFGQRHFAGSILIRPAAIYANRKDAARDTHALVTHMRATQQHRIATTAVTEPHEALRQI